MLTVTVHFTPNYQIPKKRLIGRNKTHKVYNVDGFPSPSRKNSELQGSHSIAQVGPEHYVSQDGHMVIILPKPPKCWDHRWVTMPNLLYTEGRLFIQN